VLIDLDFSLTLANRLLTDRLHWTGQNETRTCGLSLVNFTAMAKSPTGVGAGASSAGVAATAAVPMIVIIFFIDRVLNLLVLLVFVVVPLQMPSKSFTGLSAGSIDASDAIGNARKGPPVRLARFGLIGAPAP
jgi:hypothetical protein